MVGLGKAVCGTDLKTKTTVRSQLGFCKFLTITLTQKLQFKSQLGLSPKISKFEFVRDEPSVIQ